MGSARRPIAAAVLVAAAALSTAAVSGLACDRRIAGGRADGAEIYRDTCARCHGETGVPDPAQVIRLGVKDLTDPSLHGRLTDEEIRAQIEHGSKNQQMPSFAGLFTEPQLKAIVAYVRTLRRP